MHPLIEHAKATVRGWPSEEPRDLAIAVASLCKHILDDGGLPEDGSGGLRLRNALDVARGDSIAASVGAWDDLCRLGEFDISDNDAYVKLGIVTWTVKLLLKKLGMLTGESQTQELDEWKAGLCACLDKYIIVE